jgi:bifunctional non-homologous end joining protein LigD
VPKRTTHEVKITHPEKVLFPEDGITKGEFVDYYRRVAPWMLPFLKDRPVVMERYPDGIGKQGFYQKAVADYYPDWIRTVVVKKEGGTVKHAVCNDVDTLVYLANQAVITPHTWLSRVDKIDRPDQMVFDLDPSADDFAPVKQAALSMKRMLDEIGLPAFVKTTGSRGLHVVVPIQRKDEFTSVRAFAHELAELLVAEDPAQRTLEQYKNKRRGRIFVDINRNAYAQTIAPAYAVRARRGAPVSVPLDWAELRKKDLRPDGWTIRNLFDRLDKQEDPWRDYGRNAALLSKAREKLDELKESRRIQEKAGVS